MLDEWSTQLAQAIAPDEAALAPLIARAYAAGGAQRAELFKDAKNIHGAFGAGEMLAMMPMALASIAGVSGALGGLLKSDILTDVVDVTKNTVSIVELAHKLREKRAERGKPPLKPVDQEMLQAVLTKMPQQLADSGMPAEKCNEVTLQILKVLFAQPENSAQAVAELAKA